MESPPEGGDEQKKGEMGWEEEDEEEANCGIYYLCWRGRHSPILFQLSVESLKFPKHTRHFQGRH